jgi:hypothetical protein
MFRNATLREGPSSRTLGVMATPCSWLRVALFAWLLTDCDGPRMQTTVYENNGTLCVLQDGGQAQIYSLSGACNCSSIRTSTCAAVVEAGRVQVSSRTVIVTDTEAEVCPTGCETRSVLCDGEFSAEGRYEIVQGSDQTSVAFPLDIPVQIFGSFSSSYCENIVDDLPTNATFKQDAGP